MYAKINSTWKWLAAHAGAVIVLLVVVAVYGGVMLNLRGGVARPLVSATAPGLADPALTEHNRYLARLLELNTVYVPTHGPTAEDLAVNDRYLARLRELNTSGDPVVDEGLSPRLLPGQRIGPY